MHFHPIKVIDLKETLSGHSSGPYKKAIKWYMQNYHPEEFALHNLYNDWSRCTINKRTLSTRVLKHMKKQIVKSKSLTREKLRQDKRNTKIEKLRKEKLSKEIESAFILSLESHKTAKGLILNYKTFLLCDTYCMISNQTRFLKGVPLMN